jgi:hypothetical protein
MSFTVSIDDCLIRAHQDEAFIQHLTQNISTKPYYNWILVVLYYTAMHYFNAFLLSKYPGQKLPSSHYTHRDYKTGIEQPGDIKEAEEKFCITNGEAVAVGIEYGQLFNWSHDVRYTARYNYPIDTRIILEAQQFLNRIKWVTFKTVGKYVKKKIIIAPVNDGFLLNIYSQTGYKK